MSLSAEEDDIPWDNMRDNRDLTVFTSWDPKERYFNILVFSFGDWDSWLLTGWCIQVLILTPMSRSYQTTLCFFLSQTVNWWTPAAVPGGRVHLAQDTLPYSSPARFFGRAGTHAIATKLRDDQWERSGRQDVGPQQPAVPAQPDFTDGRSDGRKTPPGKRTGSTKNCDEEEVNGGGGTFLS